jgi:hypothetical protein
MFINVFFPAVAARQDKRTLLHKLDRLVLLLVGPALVLALLVLVFGLLVLRSSYPLTWPLAIGMALYGVLFFIYQTYWWFIASTGAPGIRYASLHGIVAGLGYLSGIFFLSSRFGLLSAPLSWLVVVVYLAVMTIRWRQKFLFGTR